MVQAKQVITVAFLVSLPFLNRDVVEHELCFDPLEDLFRRRIFEASRQFCQRILTNFNHPQIPIVFTILRNDIDIHIIVF